MQPSLFNFPHMMSPAELAEFLGVEKQAVLRWVRKGEAPPVVRVNRRVLRFPRDQVERWLRDRERMK